MRRMIGIAACLLALAGTVVWAAPNPQATLFELSVIETRTDLELLANEAIGPGQRPENWTFNTDIESETVVVDLWFDNELLADEIFAERQRPPEWFGATSTGPELIVRNVRHDMEIMADTVFGEEQRPEAWNGAPKIVRCDRTLQNLVRLLSEFQNVRPDTPESVVDYCRTVAQEVEIELLPTLFSDPENRVPELAWATRGDLERLANEMLGVDNRPPGWIGNVERGSPTLVADAFADLELLADTVFDRGERPEEWNPFVSASIPLSFRYLRGDLELLADLTLGEGVRPNGWEGANPLLECSPATQGLITILENNYAFQPDLSQADSENFCELVTFEANNVAENPPEIPEEVVEEEEEDTRYLAESEWAFAYLDAAALQYMGIMPAGTEFRAWYRNFNESTMMFVSGDDFAVFIDRRWTTMDPEVFATLPTTEGVRPLTFCDASWCNGPGPTPTPTGSALLALLNDPFGTGASALATDVPTDVDQVAAEIGKRPVTWTNIRVTYLLDRPETNTVQVALEICAEPQQIACEGVISVFDNAVGDFKPVISTYQGLNVYEFRYGYHQNVVIEGGSYVSSDVWISDPTLR